MKSNIISSPDLFFPACKDSIRFKFNKNNNILHIVTRKDNSEQFNIKIVNHFFQIINNIEHLVLKSDKDEIFYIVDNKFHREGDKPAICMIRKDLMETGLFKSKIWMINGLYHRENDKPALIYINGDLAWFKKGLNTRNPSFNSSFFINEDKYLVKSNVIATYFAIDNSEEEYKRHMENKLLDYSYDKVD